MFCLAGVSNPEDLCILYSNRAACYLKDGNSADCIEDCTKYVCDVYVGDGGRGRGVGKTMNSDPQWCAILSGLCSCSRFS